jgi:hypothetical protein
VVDENNGMYVHRGTDELFIPSYYSAFYQSYK